MERHIFRIVQQACENALQHGHAKLITIQARLEDQCISLRVEDNGQGFDAQNKINLQTLFENHRFGLVGMVERASFIGAKVHIDSCPGKWAHVQVEWKQANF